MTFQLELTGCTVDIKHDKNNIFIIYTKDDISHAVLYCTITSQNIYYQVVRDDLSIDDYIKNIHGLIKALENSTSDMDILDDSTIDITEQTWTHDIYVSDDNGIIFYEIILDKHNRVLLVSVLTKLIQMMKDIFKIEIEND